MRFFLFLFLLAIFTPTAWAQQSSTSAGGELHIPLPTSWTAQSSPNGEIHIFGNENIDRTLPVIKLGHDDNVECTENYFTINGTASDASGILLVQINKTQASDFGSGNFSRTINLKEGKNVFKITAIDDSDKKNKATKTVTINYKPQRKDYAILFAIDDYSGVSIYSDLDACISEAETLRDILEQRFGFDVNLVPNPTKKAMTDTILIYKNKEYGDQDQLLIFYSGHGNIDGFGMGYFVCKKGGIYEHSTFANQLDAIPCNHILLIADACYSGLIKHKSDTDPSDLIKSMYKQRTFEIFRTEQLSASLKTRKVIASGKGKTKEISNLMPQIFDALNKQNLQYDKVLNFYEVILKIFNADQALRGSFHNEDIGESNFLFIKKQ